MQSLRRWRTDVARRPIGGTHRGRASYVWCQPAPHVSDMAPASMEYHQESSRVFPCWLRDGILWFPLTNRSTLAVFWLNPAGNTVLGINDHMPKDNAKSQLSDRSGTWSRPDRPFSVKLRPDRPHEWAVAEPGFKSWVFPLPYSKENNTSIGFKYNYSSLLPIIKVIKIVE
jgi:hypothetical protein